MAGPGRPGRGAALAGGVALSALHWAQAVSPAPGEVACGDWVGHWAVPAAPASVADWLVVVDGLGHGPEAEQAAQAARHALPPLLGDPALAGRPAAVLQALGPALADTRGAAVGLAWLHQGRLRHAGVGNTRCRLWRAGRMQGLPSAWGIVGAPTPRGRRGIVSPADTELALQPGDWLLMFTDGLAENQHLERVPTAWQQQPQRLCEHVLQAWRQPRDDAAVLAAWIAPP